MTHREYLSAVKQNAVWFTKAPKIFVLKALLSAETLL